MSDQPVLLPKWFTHGGITLAKGQLGYSYTFWTRPILIFSPVANFGQQSLYCNLSFGHLLFVQFWDRLTVHMKDSLSHLPPKVNFWPCQRKLIKTKKNETNSPSSQKLQFFLTFLIEVTGCLTLKRAFWIVSER